MLRIGNRFRRVEPRWRARVFVLGLLADLPHKNCWFIAEHAGDPAPGGMQHLLGRACWDADGVRDDLRDYVTGHLGDQCAVLVADELGYMELDRRGAELLSQVLTEREEKASVAIASNESFSGWTKTFTDPRLCAAIVDRLTFAGQIIETGTVSYRLAHARQQQNASKAASAPVR
jgi:IstB-like ATP binding protein